jgi:hypothetical protein
MSSTLSSEELIFLNDLALAALRAPTLKMARGSLRALLALGFDPATHPLRKDPGSNEGSLHALAELACATRDGIEGTPMLDALLEQGFSINPAVGDISPLMSRVAELDLDGVSRVAAAGGDWLAPASLRGRTVAEMLLFPLEQSPWFTTMESEPWNAWREQAWEALAGSPARMPLALLALLERRTPFSRANHAMHSFAKAGASMAGAAAQGSSRVALDGCEMFDIAAWSSGSRGDETLAIAQNAFALDWSHADPTRTLAAFCAGSWERIEKRAGPLSGRFIQETEPISLAQPLAKTFARSSPSALFDIPLNEEQASLGWLAGVCCHYSRTHPGTWDALASWCVQWSIEAKLAGNSWSARAFMDEFVRGATNPPPRALPKDWQAEVAAHDRCQAPSAQGREHVESRAKLFFESIAPLAACAGDIAGQLQGGWVDRALHDLFDELKARIFLHSLPEGAPKAGARPFPAGFLKEICETTEKACAQGLWTATQSAERLARLSDLARQAAGLTDSSAQALAVLETLALRLSPQVSTPSKTSAGLRL